MANAQVSASLGGYTIYDPPRAEHAVNDLPPRFQLCYWPVPFRGCFISYLFAYRDVPLLEEDSFEKNAALKDQPPAEQDIPYMGPPVLRDLESGRALSQAIGSQPSLAEYVANEEQKYGKLYCGGQIEQSIRKMLEMDAE